MGILEDIEYVDKVFEDSLEWIRRTPRQRKKKEAPPKPMYLVSGCKGGVGKSIVSMTLVDYLQGRRTEVLLIETDTSCPDVGRSYGNSVETHVLDMDENEGWIDLLNLSAEQPDKTVVINGAARNNRGVNNYGEILNSGLSELKRSLFTLWVINPQRDSLDMLRKFMAVIPNGGVHVLRNEFFGQTEDFQLYNRGPLRKQVENRGGKSVTFPCLSQRVIQDLYSTPLTIAAATEELPTGNRVELKRWRRKVSDMWKDILDV